MVLNGKHIVSNKFFFNGSMNDLGNKLKNKNELRTSSFSRNYLLKVLLHHIFYVIKHFITVSNILLHVKNVIVVNAPTLVQLFV